jgi:hypothetical protein
MSFKTILLAFAFLPGGLSLLSAQDLSFSYSFRVALGLGRSRVSFYNLSGAISLQHEMNHKEFRLRPGVQLTANFYSKGLGTSIVDSENRQGQFDFITTFLATSGFYDKRPNNGLKFVRTFNQISATSIYHDLDYSVTYGTSFIVNNHGRNQQIGNINLNIDRILIGYYNDGFTPFKLFAADLFDRYWTGGAYVALGLNTFGIAEGNSLAEPNFLEFAYDRFTGDVQDSYAASNNLLIFGVPNTHTKDIFLNRALTSITLRHLDGSNIGVGFYGQCPRCDVQDFLHRRLNFPRHLSFASCRTVFIGGYQNYTLSNMKHNRL